MTEVSLNDDAVRWAVGGKKSTADEALMALAERPLLLLMHGYGSFEGDLIELAPQLPSGFVCASPRALFVAPPPIENGFAWWQLSVDASGFPVREAPRDRFDGSPEHRAALSVIEWLDTLEDRVQHATGAAMKPTALMGFSQGGAMVTSLFRLQPERFICGVNCSGFVAAGAFDGDATLAKVRPPMFWGRDPADPIIDAGRIAALDAWAPVHTTLEDRLYHGIEHGIGHDELADISAFLRHHVDGAEG